MNVRWNYKLKPSKHQQKMMSEWLVTLRKHRNYCLKERENGWNTNNYNAEDPIVYAWWSFCDIESKNEYGSCCPLTCPVIRHGVIPHQLKDEQLLRNSKKLGIAWDTASGIQSKRTTQLRKENKWYARIDSGVLVGNGRKLDMAFSAFLRHQENFPAYRKSYNFKSFQYAPGKCAFPKSNNQSLYSQVRLPGIGLMKYFDSRKIPRNAQVRTITILRESDGWYMSVLLNLADSLPEPKALEECTGVNGLDRGINKLIASSDGSFAENPKFSTNRKTKRQLKIRQRRFDRKSVGSKNRIKASLTVAKLHQKITHKRNAYQWKVALKEVKKSDVIAIEKLNVKAMKSRCKPKLVKGFFASNGQSAKRGLNRAIGDAGWSDLGSKIAWFCLKLGKHCIDVNPQHSSQECRACGHKSKANRDGEKFICENCGHMDHADTQAAKTIADRVGLKFVSNRHKKPTHKSLVPTPRLGESDALCSDSARKSKRNQAGNPIFKQLSLFAETGITERIA